MEDLALRAGPQPVDRVDPGRNVAVRRSDKPTLESHFAYDDAAAAAPERATTTSSFSSSSSQLARTDNHFYHASSSPHLSSSPSSSSRSSSHPLSPPPALSPSPHPTFLLPAISSSLALTVAALRAHQVIAVPTDTIYGFAADAQRVWVAVGDERWNEELS
ncbi:unnamed protein product [Closterium sp. NIES-64]|nr:unnamed protein product [Closterium sp. NIES-64]